MRTAAALLVMGLLAGCSAGDDGEGGSTPPGNGGDPDPPQGEPTWTEVAGGLAQPLWMLEHPVTKRLLVAEQAGRIVELSANGSAPQTWLDIEDRVGSSGSEQGLLGFALHPDFARNGVLVLSYTDLQGDSVLSRVRVPANGTPDPAVEEVLLRVDQPFENHNGGHVLWGPDGHLYLGLGDGGLAGDPMANGQNPGTLLGSLLRIDVGPTGPYTVPDDNPFQGDAKARPEVWVYGLRNPWRFHFDRATGDLWIGDVGQNAYEEVDLQPAGSEGGENYGWSLFEGFHQFPSGARVESAPGMTFPVAEYGHDGHCSVTMGPVLRDPAFAGSDLFGRALLADYCSGQAWTVTADGDLLEWMDTGATPSSFGEDALGRVHLLDHAGGRLLRLERQA